MALDVSVAREAGLLAVKARGAATLADFKGFADLIATICREEQREFVLVDLLDVAQSLSFTEHLQLGVYIAERLGFLTRMATVVPEEARSGNSERAAQKSGLRLRTFTDLAQARAWVEDGLLSRPRPPTA
jgi:hypothetical protein